MYKDLANSLGSGDINIVTGDRRWIRCHKVVLCCVDLFRDLLEQVDDDSPIELAFNSIPLCGVLTCIYQYVANEPINLEISHLKIRAEQHGERGRVPPAPNNNAYKNTFVLECLEIVNYLHIPWMYRIVFGSNLCDPRTAVQYIFDNPEHFGLPDPRQPDHVSAEWVKVETASILRNLLDAICATQHVWIYDWIAEILKPSINRAVIKKLPKAADRHSAMASYFNIVMETYNLLDNTGTGNSTGDNTGDTIGNDTSHDITSRSDAYNYIAKNAIQTRITDRSMFAAYMKVVPAEWRPIFEEICEHCIKNRLYIY